MQRTYHAVALGSPSSGEGSVATNVARDLRERKRMAAATFNGARYVFRAVWLVLVQTAVSGCHLWGCT